VEPPYDQVDLADGETEEKEQEQLTLGFVKVIFKADILYNRFYFFRFYE
jgi:hypothetical protein